MIRSLLHSLRGEEPLVIAFCCALLALVTGAVPVREIAAVVDWRILAILFAMLVSVEALRVSGLLERGVRAAVGRFRSMRGFSVALVLVAGVLAAAVTNDVALFVVIPFTLAAARVSNFEPARAVMLQIIATNLIGCVSPVGNPQNLYIFSRWHLGAPEFLAAMLPFVSLATMLLTVAAWLLAPRGALSGDGGDSPPVEWPHAGAGLVAFALTLLAIVHVAPLWPGALVALLALPFVMRHEESRIDLSIVPLFLFAFIAIEGLRRGGAYAVIAPSVHGAFGFYLSAIGGSQVISNVPMTLLLAPAASSWRLLAYGVSAGGCGSIIASLANLLGWQIYRRHGGDARHFFRDFTLLNFLFLVIMSMAGWLLLAA